MFVACSTDTIQSENDRQISEEQASTESQQKQDTLKVTNTNINLSAGAEIYKEKCMVCHQKDGKGIEATFPPLANSDYLLADKERAIIQTIVGSDTAIIVNGVEYPGNTMTTVPDLSNEEIANVVNYVLNSWGNKGGTVSPEDVEKARAKIKIE